MANTFSILNQTGNSVTNPTPKEQDFHGPKHVAIIMDGNGRWAKQRGLPRNEGHRQGVENVREIVRCVGDLGIKYLTLFAFSAENWSRPQKEISALMSLLERFLKSQTRELLKQRIRLNVLGDIDVLPAKVRQSLKKATDLTADCEKWTLNLALNYGARTEVVDAVKTYAKAVLAGKESLENLDWEHFAGYLYTAGLPDPDLIIRTSGETRLSNFLLLQGAYSEFYFSPKLWPDFGPSDLIEAIKSYKKRERRFGKTGEQLRDTLIEPALNR